MTILKFILLSHIVHIVLCETSFETVCGEPPRPYQSISSRPVERFERIVIDYSCDDYFNSEKVLRCTNGRWAGELMRCGQSIDHTVVRVGFRGSLPVNTKGDRPSGPLPFTLDEPVEDKYHWTIYLNDAEDIGFVHFRLATPEVIRDAITVTNVSVSSNKLCLATSLEINAILSGYYFECLKLEGNQSSYETNTISFETSTTSLGNTSVSAIVLEKLWLGKPVAKCGLPEILPFTRPDFVPLETSLGQEIDLVCMEGTTSVSGSSKLRCNKDGDWTGMYPKCEPKVTCYSLNISAYEIKYTGTVYDNRTYLIEGTLVQVTCSANDTPVVGSCHNGRWSLDVSCETAGQSMSMTNVIVIILSVTTAIALIVAALAAVSGRRKVAKLERRQGSYPSPYPEEYAVVSYDYPVDDGAYLEIQNEPNLVFKAANNEEATARRPTSYADVMIK